MKLIKNAGIYLASIFVLVLFLGAATQNSGDAQNGSNPNRKSDTVKGDTVKGKESFGENCAVCHEVSDQFKIGPGLQGISKKGPHKASDGTEVEDESPATLRKQIVKGGGAMPPIGAALSDKQVDDLIAYLVTL